MEFSLFLTILAAAIGFFVIFRKFRFHQENNEIGSSSSSPSSSLSPSSVPPSSSSHKWIHEVFPSFRGEDVRKNFLSHVHKEFQRKGITPFMDNEIKRGESIGPELIRAIRGSKIAIILLSRNYASSKWCLDELVEIMKCRKELGQTVMVVFYQVDPSDVKKLTGDFGNVFRKTCVGKTKEDIGRWREALAKVATIAGYHLNNWDNEAAMIEKIAADVSTELINSVPSSDFDTLVGMRGHMEKMEPFLCLYSSEVRMIGIWGPSGIGKSTIARFLFSKHSREFQLSIFMENIKGRYPRPCFDEYSAKLKLQKKFLSKLLNQENIKIHHLGVAEGRLKDKRVLVVLDDVDNLVQLEAMAKETRWFGPGSQIIITTQDKKLLTAHRINHIYAVDFPTNVEAHEIFCMHAFGQTSPYAGFEKLSWEVTQLAGNLPLGLKVMGSYFKGMLKHEWKEALPRLRASLHREIEDILKFSYDALCEEDQYLFLYIACFFNNERIEKVEKYLAKNFVDVRQGLRVLAERSLISINNSGYIKMHDLLARLGREIVRKQSIYDLGQRQFLVDARDICQVLNNDAVGGRSVIGIDFKYSEEIEDELNISERAFERMSSLQFLRARNNHEYQRSTHALQQSLNNLPRKLRLLHWEYFPMTCLPSNFNLEFLVELNMPDSKLEKLWEGIQTIRNLKWINLNFSKNLKELPDLSTATNLEELNMVGCFNLLELISSIGNAIDLKKLDLRGCSSLVELPSSLGNCINLEELDLVNCASLVRLPLLNAINLRYLDLFGCSSLVELPSSIGNLRSLLRLNLRSCSKLKTLPININMESLDELDLTDCSSLKTFPEISTNIRVLILKGTAVEEVPSSIRSWPRLDELHMSYSEKLGEFPDAAFDRITKLHLNDKRIQEIAPWIRELSRLSELVIKGCTKLVSLPQLPKSLPFLDAENCESLETLDCSLQHIQFARLRFANCCRQNQEARELIIKTSTSAYALLPGGKVPSYFTHRATGSSLSVKLNGFDTHLPISLKFKACVLPIKMGNVTIITLGDERVCYRVTEMQNGVNVKRRLEYTKVRSPLLLKHLHIFEFDEEVSSSELVFEFEVHDFNFKIGECGIQTLGPSC